jgi:hypothetical protein
MVKIPHHIPVSPTVRHKDAVDPPPIAKGIADRASTSNPDMNPTAVSIADIRDMTKDIGVISFDCVGLTSSLVLAGKEGLGSRASVSSPGVEIEAHSVRLVISSNSCRPRTGRNAFVQTIEVEYDTFAIMVIAAAAMGIHCRGE